MGFNCIPFSLNHIHNPNGNAKLVGDLLGGGWMKWHDNLGIVEAFYCFKFLNIQKCTPEVIQANKQTWGNIYKNWKGWGMTVKEIMISKKYCSINESTTQNYAWNIQNVPQSLWF